MSCRVDTVSLIPGACVVGDRGLGLPGAVIRAATATGVHGPGMLYGSLSPSDDGSEIRGLVTSTSPGVTADVDESGSVAMTVPGDGTHWVAFRLFVDGVDLGPLTYTAVVGAGPAPATAITLTGPVAGLVGAASAVFTVGANGPITGAVTVTPSAGAGGGSFSPASVTISAGTATAGFTYTPASEGAKSITLTNDGGLSNPTVWSFSASTATSVMLRNLLSTIPSGIGAGLQVWGTPQWGLLGSDILAAISAGDHGPGLAVNDGLTPGLRYVYLLESRSSPSVILHPDSSHEGPVPYSGVIRLYEEGTGEVSATEAARTFSVTAGAPATAPTISTQPQPQSVTEGASVTFSVTASGTAPLAYQWRRNGLAISGATASSYTLAGATLADSGAVFSVLVSNAAGSVSSSGAALTVTGAAAAPTITVQPQPQSVAEGASATFSVTASGTAPLAYQWRRNGLAISGATASSYTLAGATLADSGAVFSVLVSNAAGSVSSSGAALTVTGAAAAPTITVQPQPQSVAEGASATFSVTASGTTPLAYQWRRNGLAISGATASSYTLSGATLADSGAVFSVLVSNAAGSVTSSGAVLTVSPVQQPGPDPDFPLEPVTVAQAMAAARLDDVQAWQHIVAGHIAAAREYCEHLTGRCLMQQTRRIELADWPLPGRVFAVYRPTAVAISYWTGAAFAQLDPSVFAWDCTSTGFQVAPEIGASWPVLAAKAVGHRVRIDATAGATAPDQVPAVARTFILALVCLMVDNPTLTAERAVQENQYLVRMLDPLKVYAA